MREQQITVNSTWLGYVCCSFKYYIESGGSLEPFNTVDMQAVIKADGWSCGGTFTSFYLRDVCPQADRIRKAGPVVAAGETER